MNTLRVKVTEIQENDIVTYIHVNKGESDLQLTQFQKPSWLKVGDEVNCRFHEGYVCLSKECPGKVSIENTLPVTLKAVRKSKSLCELTLDNRDLGEIVSLITENAYEKLGLEEGCSAMMLLRGSDIKLEPVLEIKEAE